MTKGEQILDDWMTGVIDYVRSGQPDLTNRQMALLLMVSRTQGPHTVRGIASKLRVSKPVVTRALNRLGTLGYLTRQRDTADKRNIFVVLTGKGASFLDEFERLISGHQRGGIERRQAA